MCVIQCPPPPHNYKQACHIWSFKRSKGGGSDRQDCWQGLIIPWGEPSRRWYRYRSARVRLTGMDDGWDLLTGRDWSFFGGANQIEWTATLRRWSIANWQTWWDTRGSNEMNGRTDGPDGADRENQPMWGQLHCSKVHQCLNQMGSFFTTSWCAHGVPITYI